MKLQHLALIFLLIVIPISLVLSTYTSNNIDVIQTQADYDNILLGATNDAISAYQMNTLRNGYSTINDSKIRDISASVSSFFNSLALGLGSSGYSREDLEGYIPALLFTLYDGYYLYGDYQNTVNIVNGEQVYLTDNSNQLSSRTGVKPFIYYTCEYKNSGNLDIVINYTLDNYITVMGTDNNGNIVNISGYLIDPTIVSNINESSQTLTAHGVQIEPETLGEYIVAIDTVQRTGEGQTGTEYRENEPEYFQYVYYNNQKYYIDPDANNDNGNGSSTYVPGVNFFRLNNNLRVYLTDTEANGLANYLGYSSYLNLNATNFKDSSAYKYYYEASQFTNTFLNIVRGQNLEIVTDSFNNQLNYTTLSEDSGEEVPVHAISSDYYDPDTHIISGVFDIGNNNDPETESSLFNEHRMDVIISSIESNLMSIISNFNIHHNSGFEFALPVLSEDDWNIIANNVTIVSFMQGMPIGNYKYYSNYSIVANTKNKEFVSRYSILLRNRESGNRTGSDGDPTGTYHDPRCMALNGLDTSVTVNTSDLVGYNIIDYQQQLTSYDVVDPSSHQTTQTLTYYYYPHSGSGAYECVIGKEDILFTVDNLISGTGFHSTNDAYDSVNLSEFENKVADANVRKAYITALAREKYNLYKVNDYFDDYNP